VRGKTGRVNGDVVALLTLLKGQPLAYNKDNQEDKEPLFDSVDTVKACVRAYADMIPAIEIKRENMYDAALRGYATATDLADYLVRKGMPFRDAHEAVGKAVRYGIERNKDLAAMELSELQQFSTIITGDVFEVLTLEGSVVQRDHLGGTAPRQVRAAVLRARRRI
jgi:argininosuccinate lyase